MAWDYNCKETPESKSCLLYTKNKNGREGYNASNLNLEFFFENKEMILCTYLIYGNNIMQGIASKRKKYLSKIFSRQGVQYQCVTKILLAKYIDNF